VLILFDIDATLLTTRGLGIEAMRRAAGDVFGDLGDLERVDSAGRLDPLIMSDMLAVGGLDPSPESIDAFRRAYYRRLDEILTPGVASSLPGVPELLEALASIEGVAIGLVTGNLPETGLLKLERASIDADLFTIRAWATDSPHEPPARDHLPGVALARYAEIHRRDADRALTTIIGDTPHDVQCAKAHALRCLSVSTGKFDSSSLERAGADLVVDDLSATEEILRWLKTSTPARA